MKNSSIYRANLSDEKIAFLSEMKEKKEAEKKQTEYNDGNAPKAYKRPVKEKEIDLLWQAFKINPKEEKSPGIYLLTGFIAGALCIFIMASVMTINSGRSSDPETALGQPKFEKKISKKGKTSEFNSVSVIPADIADDEYSDYTENSTEIYTVKKGDSMSSIVYRFYGKYDPSKVEKIRHANNLTSANRLSVGQRLIIPLD